MKTEELTALGLTDEQATQVLAIHGKDIEKHKKQIETLEGERNDYKGRFETADAALKKFDGIDPEQIQSELQTYRQRAEDAEKEASQKITARDQRDWLKEKFDAYGVTSPYARRQLASDCMDAKDGLKWKDGAFLGFDDFMKSAKEKDKSLYLTEDEKKEVDKQNELQGKAPRFTGPTGDPAPQGEKFIPPKIF